jgi:glycosyltransferase involved in cell wall biosynthesis
MNVIFLHPDSDRNSISGSSLRPRKIKEAFDERGYSVLSIVGNREERLVLYQELKIRLTKGESFDYLYVESLSRSMNLRIASFRGLQWFERETLDFDIIDTCLKFGIKTGFFLRDIYWDFGSKSLFGGGIKDFYLRYFLKKFGKKELDFLRSRPIRLYGPSQEFFNHLSDKWNIEGSVLRPGSIAVNSESRMLGNPLQLLYVGGCVGVYDPSVFFKGTDNADNIHFTFCTRKPEWEEYKRNSIVPTVEVVHKSGKELEPLYKQANLAVDSPPPENYIKLAFGVKLVEYVANGLPIIAYKGTEAARFIEENDIGWTIEYNSEEVTRALNHISKAKGEYERKQQNVIALQSELSWQKVIDRLEKNLLQ